MEPEVSLQVLLVLLAMTPQYYPQKHSERKDLEADKIVASKELSNSNAKQKTGRNSIVKENPDSLDSDLMDAVSRHYDLALFVKIAFVLVVWMLPCNQIEYAEDLIH